jgi:hypothetical protein
MLSYYSFERMTIIWWKKPFFHPFDLVVVHAHILHNKTSNKKMSLGIFYEKVAEGLLACTEIQVQGQSSSPAGRLVGRDHFLYRIPSTHAKLERKSQRSCRVCVRREASARPGKVRKNALQCTAKNAM